MKVGPGRNPRYAKAILPHPAGGKGRGKEEKMKEFRMVEEDGSRRVIRLDTKNWEIVYMWFPLREGGNHWKDEYCLGSSFVTKWISCDGWARESMGMKGCRRAWKRRFGPEKIREIKNLMRRANSYIDAVRIINRFFDDEEYELF